VGRAAALPHAGAGELARDQPIKQPFDNANADEQRVVIPSRRANAESVSCRGILAPGWKQFLPTQRSLDTDSVAPLPIRLGMTTVGKTRVGSE
jgi:hypothetical protein